MVQFTTTILKFEEAGDKTGWTYIEVPADIAQQLMPGNKKSFRVKGYLNQHPFEGVSLLPRGGGDFIMALNASLRKGIRKKHGALLQVRLEVDTKPLLPPQEFLDCLADEPEALERFNKLTKGHRNYFIKWINEAKTEPTRIKRIAHTVDALSRGFDFGQMIRSLKEERNQLKF